MNADRHTVNQPPQSATGSLALWTDRTVSTYAKHQPEPTDQYGQRSRTQSTVVNVAMTDTLPTTTHSDVSSVRNTAERDRTPVPDTTNILASPDDPWNDFTQARLQILDTSIRDVEDLILIGDTDPQTPLLLVALNRLKRLVELEVDDQNAFVPGFWAAVDSIVAGLREVPLVSWRSSGSGGDRRD